MASGRAPAARGFTLVELMVSLALGMLILAGAFQLHAAFGRQSNRQQRVVDMQQSLRVGRDVIARALRNAGSGMHNVPIQFYNAGSGTFEYFFPVQFSNSNLDVNYTGMKTAFDTSPGDRETDDPDWLRIVSLDAADASAILPGGWDPVTRRLSVASIRPFQTNFSAPDFVYIDNNDRDPARRLICARLVTQVTAVDPNNCIATPCTLELGNSPANPDPTLDTCMRALYTPTSVPVFKLNPYSTVLFRVVRNNAVNPPTARLEASYTAPTAPTNFQALSDDIEDLQVATLHADGRICGAVGNSIDGPVLQLPGFGVPPCDARSLRAVRFSLVARTPSWVPGFNQGHSGGDGTGNLEDADPGPLDGYLRRSVTTIVQMRNFQ